MTHGLSRLFDVDCLGEAFVHSESPSPCANGVCFGVSISFSVEALGVDSMLTFCAAWLEALLAGLEDKVD